MMTWGMIMADTGRRIGRKTEKIDSEDVEAARTFYAEVRRIRPAVFKAHRAYCESVLSDAG